MITGKYIFKSNGQIVAEKNNILTASGINAINLYLVGSIVDWAGSIALGSQYTVTASTDQRLAFEVSRSPVATKTYVPSTKQIVVKATVDPTFVGSIYEIGIVPQNNLGNSVRNNTFVSDFNETYTSASSYNSPSSLWTSGANLSSLSTASLSSFSRAGTYSIQINTSSVAYLNNLSINGSRYSYLSVPSDYIDLLYYVPQGQTNATSPNLTFIFADLNSNTWKSVTSALPISSSGYQTASFALSNAPDTNFNYTIYSVTASFSGGISKNITLDSLRLRSGTLFVPDELLLSRASSSVALFTTSYGQPLEIEYYLTVT
jgi:hypothetical protein